MHDTQRGTTGLGLVQGRVWDGPCVDQGQRVEVLTPRTVVVVIGAGYVFRVIGTVDG